MELRRTTAQDPDFRRLVKELDAYLVVTDGEDNAFYHQYNGLADIHHVVVAYEEGAAVGCGAFKPYEGKTVEIKRMYSSPDHRGRGIAAAVLTELERWAAEEGYTAAILETGTRQVEAMRFYPRRGYVETARYGQYTDMENSHCFRKFLQVIKHK